MTPQDIRQMLARADAAERRSEDAYWRGKTTEYHDDADRQFDREREYANEARSLRAKAWALVQADPSLKPDGVNVPEVYMLEPVAQPIQSRVNALLAERLSVRQRAQEMHEKLLSLDIGPKNGDERHPAQE